MIGVRYNHNPLSDKRRYFLEQNYARRFNLDEASLENVDKIEIAARKAKLNQLLDWLAEADPTISGKYAMWIGKLHKRNLIQFPEDIGKINDRLQKFELIKHTLPADKKDISVYKTYGELAKTLDQHSGIGIREAERIATSEGQEVILEEGGFRVIKTTTQEATTKLARHTEWCVKDPSWGAGYLEWGPLYFIDKLNPDGTSSRFALAYAAICEPRRQQYKKFKEFIEDAQDKEICVGCLKPLNRCFGDHFSDEITSYADFNDDNVFDNYDPVPEHLRPFFSHTSCYETYSVLDVYDDPLSDSDLRSIMPIVIELLLPDLATVSRENLDYFYRAILLHRKSPELEKRLLELGDPNKILDYYEQLVIDKRGRWRRIEPIVFRNAISAARYYEIIQDNLSVEDLREITTLGKSLPAVDKPIPKLPFANSSSRHLLTNYRRKKSKTEEKIKGMRRRLRREKKAVVDKMARATAKNEKNYQNLLDAVDKAISQADKGVPIEVIISNLQLVASKYYNYHVLGRALEDDVDHPFNQFLIDFIGHYAKGFVTKNTSKQDKRRIRRQRQGAPYAFAEMPGRVFSAETFVSMPWKFRTRKRSKRKRQQDRHQEALASYANRVVASGGRSRRGNPLEGWGQGSVKALQRSAKQYKKIALGAVQKLQYKIWEFLRLRGLQWSKGFTFMSQADYVKHKMRYDYDRGKVERLGDLRSRGGFSAPGFILCSCTLYDDLYSILTKNIDSHFFEKMREKYFRKDPLTDEKLFAISDKLNKSFLSMLSKLGWGIDMLDPHTRIPSLKINSKKYPHKHYKVFALYPLKAGRRDRLDALIPYFPYKPD